MLRRHSSAFYSFWNGLFSLCLDYPKSRKNNVGTEVVNQCINTVLRYVVKKRAGHRVERPVQLWDTTGKTPIPDLPAPGSFDMITAGFPWYGFSLFHNDDRLKKDQW